MILKANLRSGIAQFERSVWRMEIQRTGEHSRRQCPTTFIPELQQCIINPNAGMLKLTRLSSQTSGAKTSRFRELTRLPLRTVPTRVVESTSTIGGYLHTSISMRVRLPSWDLDDNKGPLIQAASNKLLLFSTLKRSLHNVHRVSSRQ